MVAWGTLGTKSAFKMLCRAKEIDVDIANEVTKLITSYEIDKKHNSSVVIEDYIKDDYQRNLLKESESYKGIIDSFSQHACAMLLFNGDLRREFGLLRAPNGELVVNVTGVEAEKLGYLKNDFLIVQVVGMNDRLYSRIGIPQFSSNELYDKVRNDDKIWDLYGNGFTMCLNQMESTGTTEKAKKFKPKTVEELCNFVAIIRPATASIYRSFEKREKFEYGIKELDKIIQGDFLESSWIIYQEQLMILFQWLGFPDSETYSVMKAISKKKVDVINAVKERFEEKLIEFMIQDALDKREVVEID